MKKCKHCKVGIHDDANKCQHCGGDQRHWFRRHWIITGMLLFFSFIFIIASLKEEGGQKNIVANTPTKEEEIITIDADDLYEVYTRNEINADAKYKDKILVVTGTVNNIGKDIFDNPYVQLKSTDIIFGVQCMLRDSEQNKAGQLNKGQRITMQGRNQGKFGNILLRLCTIQ